MPRFPLVLLALSSPLLAQSGPQPYAAVEEVPWKPASPGGAFHRAGALDLSGNGSPDGFVLRDGLLVVHPEVGAFTSSTPVSSGGGNLIVNDVCAVDNGGPRLATVGPDGLVLVELASDGTITTQTEPYADWVDARCVREAGGDLYALDAAGTTVLRLFNLGGGYWISNTPVALPLPAYDLHPIEFDGDGGVELLVSDDLGVRVVDPATGPVYNRVSPVAPGEIEVLHNGPGTLDSIAWGLNVASGTVVNVIEPDGTAHVTLVDGRPPMVSMTAGYANSDDLSDLVLGFDDDYELLLLTHLGMAPVFDDENPDVAIGYDTTLSPFPPPAGAPIGDLADVDGDGEADLLASVEGNDSTLVFHGPLDPLSGQPAGDRTLHETPISFCVDGAGRGVLNVDMAYTPPQDTDHFRILIFEQADIFSYPEPVSVSNCAKPASSSANYALQIVFPSPAGIDWEDDVRLLHLVIQPLKADGATATGPKIVAHLSIDGPSLAAMDLNDDWSDVFEIIDPLSCDGQPSGGNPVGGFALGHRLPSFGPGDSPTINNFCVTTSHGTGSH